MVVWTNKYGEWEVGGGPGVVLESRSGEEEASGAAVVVWASVSDER